MSAGGDTRIKSKDGETYIAATQRPDGTWRKPRRVREGYIPQDEQPKFECSAQKALRDQTGALKYPVGLSPLELQKKVQARQQKPETSKAPVAAIVKPNAPITPKDHFQKKINNLQKKLDEIEKLKEKIDNGELKNPEKTQLQKIERRHEIESEMEKLIQEMEKL